MDLLNKFSLTMNRQISKSGMPFSAIILILLILPNPSSGLIEEIEATPTNTNGIELGELSLPQFALLMLIFLKMTLLYSVGVLPLEIRLGKKDYDYYSDYEDYDDYGQYDTSARAVSFTFEKIPNNQIFCHILIAYNVISFCEFI